MAELPPVPCIVPNCEIRHNAWRPPARSPPRMRCQSASSSSAAMVAMPCIGALPQFDVLGDHRDAVIAPDAQERVRNEVGCGCSAPCPSAAASARLGAVIKSKADGGAPRPMPHPRF